jgi:hypothetical protein
MNLDELIRDADPARELRPAVGDAASFDRVYRRAVRRERSAIRRAAPASVLVALGGVSALVVALALPGGAALSPPSAAAAVLRHAAVATAATPDTTLGAGQYLYGEIQELAPGYYQWGNNDPAESAWTVQPETIQTWVAADGSDHRITTYNGPIQLLGAQSQAGWQLAGEPSLAPDANTASGQYDTQDGPGAFTAPDDLSQLPTDPASLTTLIETGKTGLADVSFQPDSATPAYTFITAAQMLAEPALGSSSALRAALYEVMAAVPGAELVGSASDHAGRTGTEIASPVGNTTYGIPGGGAGVRDEVIIDPASGNVLEIAEVLTDPALAPASFTSEFGDTTGQVLAWTDYISAGVVGSSSATS